MSVAIKSILFSYSARAHNHSINFCDRLPLSPATWV